MNQEKILNWKDWGWKGYVLYVIALSIFIVILFELIFGFAPTKETTENFLRENSCNPYTTKTDSDSEHSCAYYLRRHTTLMFGKIISIPGFIHLFAYNPFGYFNYDPTLGDPSDWGCASTNSCKNDEHSYVFVVTRDEGPLVYNPVNGNFIGSYNDLTLKMGCKIPPNKGWLYQIKKYNLEMDHFRCTLDIDQKMIDTLKLNATDNYVCSFNAYDCSHFTTHSEAQNVYSYCIKQGKEDIHHLDEDNDGLACESLSPYVNVYSSTPETRFNYTCKDVGKSITKKQESYGKIGQPLNVTLTKVCSANTRDTKRIRVYWTIRNDGTEKVFISPELSTSVISDFKQYDSKFTYDKANDDFAYPRDGELRPEVIAEGGVNVDEVPLTANNLEIILDVVYYGDFAFKNIRI